MRGFDYSVVGLASLALAACSSEPESQWQPRFDPAPNLALERMVASPAGLRGFDGAAPSGASLSLGRDGSTVAMAVADEHGRFELRASLVSNETVDLQFEGAAYSFRVRDLNRARAQTTGPVIAGAGTTPNDLVVVGEGADARAVVVRSGDNAVSVFDLSTGFDGAPLGVRLPEQEDKAANPWFVTPYDNADRYVVTAFGQRGAYLVNLANAQIEEELFAQDELRLFQPFTLSRPFDVDGDGEEEGVVSAFVPRSAQSVAVSDDAVFVGFVNLIAPTRGANRAIFLPGVVARFDRSDLSAEPTLIELPFINPQFILHEDGKLIVICSGAVDFDENNRPAITTDGGLVELNPTTNEIINVTELGRFGASHAVFSAGRLWVSSLITARVRSLDPSGATAAVEHVLNQDAVDSVFRLLALPEGLVLAGSFGSDRLHVIDARTGELSPPLFEEPFAVGPGLPVFDGLHTVARRPGRRGIDFEGPDIFVLSSLAARVRGLELRQLFGP